MLIVLVKVPAIGRTNLTGPIICEPCVAGGVTVLKLGRPAADPKPDGPIVKMLFALVKSKPLENVVAPPTPVLLASTVVLFNVSPTCNGRMSFTWWLVFNVSVPRIKSIPFGKLSVSFPGKMVSLLKIPIWKLPFIPPPYVTLRVDVPKLGYNGRAVKNASGDPRKMVIAFKVKPAVSLPFGVTGPSIRLIVFLTTTFAVLAGLKVIPPELAKCICEIYPLVMVPVLVMVEGIPPTKNNE